MIASTFSHCTGAGRLQARRAKDVVRRLLAAADAGGSVGLTRRGDGYAVRVSLRQAPAVDLPSEVDGVPLELHVVGEVSAQPGVAKGRAAPGAVS